jgi:hypothetical protein
MACNVSAARGIDCRDAIGGLKAIYFTKTYEPNILKEAAVAATSYEITQANFANWSTADTGVVTLYKYDLVTDLSSFSSAVEADKATGSVMWNQTLTVVLQKVVTADLYQLGLISKNRMQIWVQDSNDNVYLMGINDGCYLTGGDSIVTGAGRSDMNGLNLTFTAKEVAPLYTIPLTSGPSTTDYPFDGLSDADANLTIVTA